MDRTITALKAQKRNPDRINVYLDGDFAFGVSRLIAAWLSIGQTLTEGKIGELQDQDLFEKALQKALTILSYRPRSELEVRRKLIDSGYGLEVVAAVVNRLVENRLIGDPDFARMWVENRTTFRPRSHRFLALELRQKGIADEVIRETLTNTAEDVDLALDAARRYAHRLQEKPWDEFRAKMTAFLGRRGFPYGVCSSTVHQVWEELQDQKGNET